jgi:hypothetical protein
LVIGDATATSLAIGRSGITTDFPSGSTVDFTGATVTGLSAAQPRVESSWNATGLTVGAPVFVSGTDAVSHGNANAVSTSDIIGLVSTSGATGKVVTHGITTASFAAGDTMFSAGDVIYLSTTTGRITFTRPTTAGDTIFELGYLRDSTGLSATTVDGETAEIFFNVGPRILIGV